MGTLFNPCCDMVHRIPVYRFNSRKSSLYTDHQFSLCRSSSSHKEIKTAGEFIVFKRNGFGVEVGKGENRRALSKRKRLRTGELKLDPTASNTIKRSRKLRPTMLDEVGPTLTIVGSIKAWLNHAPILNN